MKCKEVLITQPKVVSVVPLLYSIFILCDVLQIIPLHQYILFTDGDTHTNMLACKNRLGELTNAIAPLPIMSSKLPYFWNNSGRILVMCDLLYYNICTKTHSVIIYAYRNYRAETYNVYVSTRIGRMSLLFVTALLYPIPAETESSSDKF